MLLKKKTAHAPKHAAQHEYEAEVDTAGSGEQVQGAAGLWQRVKAWIDGPNAGAASSEYPRPAFDSAVFRRPDKHGFRGAFSGRVASASPGYEAVTATNYGCGFNPWVVGATAPDTGTPLGIHNNTGEDVSCDPLSWYQAGHIANPSAFVLSLPGLGKSSLIRKWFIGAVAHGQIPIVAGDIRPEYVRVTEAMVKRDADGNVVSRGQVIKLGHGEDLGSLNPLSAGALGSVIPILEANLEVLKANGKDEKLIDGIKDQVHSRQVTMMVALIELHRGRPVEDWESLLISRGLRELRASDRFSFAEPPLIGDLVEQIQHIDSPTMQQAVFAASAEEYRLAVVPLVRSLNALTDGQLGSIFANHTTTPIDLEAPAICIDVSAIARGDNKLKAATLLTCWSEAFGAMEASHVLAECGLAKQKNFLSILDELWQVIGAGGGMVQRVDELTRLNRKDGTGLVMITHTGRDLESLPNEVDIKTALGFIERSGMVVCGGLPRAELDRLSDTLQFTSAEAGHITSWSRGAPITRRRRYKKKRAPLGQGRFMIKPSKDGAAGIPVRVLFTSTERRTRIHDTDIGFRDFLADRSEQVA